MVCVQLPVLLLLLSLGQASCQAGGGKEEAPRIPRWGTGLIAVAVFLALVLICYVANKVWDRRSEPHLESVTLEKFQDGGVPNGNTGRYITKDSENGTVMNVYENPIRVTDEELSSPM